MIDFDKNIEIAMIRVWNYNKSRTHANRGVRRLKIQNEKGIPLFAGEIKKATGTCSRTDNYEVILFTQ